MTAYHPQYTIQVFSGPHIHLSRSGVTPGQKRTDWAEMSGRRQSGSSRGSTDRVDGMYFGFRMGPLLRVTLIGGNCTFIRIWAINMHCIASPRQVPGNQCTGDNNLVAVAFAFSVLPG